MNALEGIFLPGSLLIWLPGLLFAIAAIYSLLAKKKETPQKYLYLNIVTAALFVISLILTFAIPINQMNRAVAFANAYQGYDGPEITSYDEIPYEVGMAWSYTALPEDERPVTRAASDDMFSFDAPADAEQPETQSQAEEAGAAGGEELVYRPQRSMAWFLLIFCLIPGCLFLLQDFRNYLRFFRRSMG